MIDLLLRNLRRELLKDIFLMMLAFGGTLAAIGYFTMGYQAAIGVVIGCGITYAVVLSAITSLE